MASSYDIRRQLKPKMRVTWGADEIFHFRIPEPEPYEHMTDDDDAHSDSSLLVEGSTSPKDDQPDQLLDIKTKPSNNSTTMMDDNDDYYDDGYQSDSSLLVQGSTSPKDEIVQLLMGTKPPNKSSITHEHDHHEFDSPKNDCFSPSLDDYKPTLHQHHDHDLDHDHDEHYSIGPLSPPRSASYFDCNMCLKLAREPVVTSCGHLYCWPCLHSWLNIYSAQLECLVCKSRVFESLITPIYSNRNLNSGFNVPPRPGGFRLEDFA